MTCHYLISFTYSRIWLKLVFLPTVSLHAAPMQKRVLPASFACQRMRICPNDAPRKRKWTMCSKRISRILQKNSI